jgi:c-di-GMP-binding flagellar brake protein YcgR
VPSETPGRESAEAAAGTNRRSYFRAAIEWRGTYRRTSGPADELATFWALDLSATGAALELHGELPRVGESLELHFTTSTRFQVDDLRLVAIVGNRRRPPHHRVVGVAFETLSQTQSDLLSRVTLTAQRLEIRQRRPR